MNTIVEGISEFDTKCKALIFVKLMQQSRNCHTKKLVQRLNQQCIEVIFDEYLDSEVVFV